MNDTPQAWALDVAGLSFAYPDGHVALQEISFRVARNERVAILGANGAGKSTLLLHLNGLHPSPQVTACGLPAHGRSLAEVRRRVGLLFQNPDDQLFCPTVREDVAFGPQQAGLPRDEIQRRVDESLAAMGLTALADRHPSHLSIGQKKRAALAAVLSLSPDVLVLDEPTSNLDPRGRRELITLLETLPTTLVVATHDFDFARRLCPRSLVLDTGRRVADGPTGELLANPAFLDAHGLA